jgi:hypothetical protein
MRDVNLIRPERPRQLKVQTVITAEFLSKFYNLSLARNNAGGQGTIPNERKDIVFKYIGVQAVDKVNDTVFSTSEVQPADNVPYSYSFRCRY